MAKAARKRWTCFQKFAACWLVLLCSTLLLASRLLGSDAGVRPPDALPATEFHPGAVYFLESVVAAGKYLNVAGGAVKNGAPVQLWDNPASPDTQWRMVPGLQGVFAVENVHAAGKYLNVAGGAHEDGAHIQLWDNPRSPDSQWRILPQSGGAFVLENVHATKMYLNVLGGSTKNGAAAVLGSNPQSPHAQWRLFSRPAGRGAQEPERGGPQSSPGATKLLNSQRADPDELARAMASEGGAEQETRRRRDPQPLAAATDSGGGGSLPRTTTTLRPGATATAPCPSFSAKPGAGFQFSFLPKVLKGATILTPLSACRWRLDDTVLQSGMESVAYRKTKTMGDKIVGVHATFGDVVEGIDEGDGWVKFRIQEVRDWAEPSHDSGPSAMFAPTATKVVADR